MTPRPKRDLPVVRTTGQDESARSFRSATTRRDEPVHSGFGTPLGTLLNVARADSVVLTGGTTSGCVRASAVDAFSAGYPTFVAADCCFDRSSISHDVSLFDLSHKYATVLDSEELAAQLAGARAADAQDEGAP